MNLLRTCLLFFIPVLFSCDLRVREQNIERRADSIDQKEQRLLFFENQLNARQTTMDEKERTLDSLLKKYIPPDSLSAKMPFLIGRWNVKMVCTETTCAGSAVGDNKTEVWELSYQDNAIIAKAMVSNQIVRVYSGAARGNELLLTAQQESASAAANITVSLLFKNDTEMEGIRKIISPNECRILYAVQMQKIVTP